MDAFSISHAQAKPPGGGTLSLIILHLLPVIYILSTGPAAKLAQTLHLPGQAHAFEHALDIIYEPIIWSAEKWPALDGALDWYCSDVWQVK